MADHDRWAGRKAASRQLSCSPMLEQLEPRLLLSATYEVWGGDTNYEPLPEHWNYYYSIDQQDYAKLGEADGDATFFGTENYEYLVIAARDHLYVDAIQRSDGSYLLGGLSPTGNTTNHATGMSGEPDGEYTFFDGDANSGGTFGSYAVFHNWKPFSSIHLLTGGGSDPRPDLVVNVDSYQTGTFNRGDWIQASGWEQNIGDAAASPTFYIELALSTDRQWDAGDIEVLWLTEDEGLDAGERYPTSGSVTESIQIPTKTPFGSYYLLAKIDSTGVIEESNEGNNVWASLSNDIVVADISQPDLIISSTSPTQISATPGETLNVEIITRNAGGGDALPAAWISYFETQLFLSTDAVVTDQDQEVADGQGEMPRLDAGQSLSRIHTFSAPTQPGTYYLKAMADEFDAVDETNEGNNWGQLITLTVDVASGSPDLVINSTSPTQISATPGETLNVEIITRNAGGGDALPAAWISYFETQLFLSTDAVVNDQDQEVANDQGEMPRLDAWQSLSQTHTFSAPTQPGTYYLKAMADEFDAVDEANEGNNWGQLITLTVGSEVISLQDKVEFLDADGDWVTVRLTGGGEGILYRANAGWSDLSRIVLTGTTDRSSLTITTKGRGSDTTIGEIIVDNGWLKRLTAKTTDIVGGGISATGNGYIGSIHVRDIRNGADIFLPGDGAPRGITIKAGQLFADTDIVLGSYLKNLTATQWTGSSLTAPWASSISIKGDRRNGIAGDFGADLTFTGADPKKDVALGKLQVAGTITDSVITANFGSVGTIMAAQWDAGSLDAVWAKNIMTKGKRADRNGLGGLAGDFGADLTLTGQDTRGMSLNKLQVAGRVTGSQINLAGAGGTLMAAQWDGGAINGTWIKTLTSKGNRRDGSITGAFAADITLSGIGATRSTLNKANIAGNISGGTWLITGDAGTIKAGLLAGDISISGNVKSMKLAQPLSLMPPVGGEAGRLQVGGTVAINVPGQKIKLADTELYSNSDGYDFETDLRHYNVLGAWWDYDVTFTMNRVGGTDVTHVEVENVSQGPGRTDYEVSAVSRNDPNVNLLTSWFADPQGVRMSSWRIGMGGQEYIDISYPGGPIVAPPSIVGGETYSASSPFNGSWQIRYDGQYISGDCSGAGTVVTKVLGLEKVAVPSGTYVALKGETTTTATGQVEFQYSGSFFTGNLKITEKQTWWFSPGVGGLKAVTSQTITVTVPGVASWSYRSQAEQVLVDYALSL